MLELHVIAGMLHFNFCQMVHSISSAGLTSLRNARASGNWGGVSCSKSYSEPLTVDSQPFYRLFHRGLMGWWILVDCGLVFGGLVKGAEKPYGDMVHGMARMVMFFITVGLVDWCMKMWWDMVVTWATLEWAVAMLESGTARHWAGSGPPSERSLITL